MEITLPVSELKFALPGLAKVASKSSCLPALHSLLVTRARNGTVQLQATDIDCFAAYRFKESQAGYAVELLVPFEPLSKTVKGCANTDQIVLVGDKNRLTLRYPLAGRYVEQPMSTSDPKDFPPAPTIETTSIPVDEHFKEALHKAFECCSDESARACLQGAWVDVTDAKAHYVMGTDGRHLFSANSFNLDLRESLLIPNTKFLHWPGFKEDGPWTLAFQPDKAEDNEGWIQLQSDRWTFLSRSQDHTIPNWRQVIPSSSSVTVTVTFSEKASQFLIDLLPKLPGMDELTRPIRFDIASRKLSVTAKDRNTDHETTIPVEDVEIVGPDLTITVNRNFVAKALKWRLTVMELVDELTPLVFSSPGKRLLAMPLRSDSTPVPNEPEASSVAQPQQPQESVETSTEEAPMPRIVTATTAAVVPTTTPTIRANPEPQPTNRIAQINGDVKFGEAKSSVRSAIDQIDDIKEALKAVVRQFGDVVDALRLIEKEKKANDKEVEGVREKLRAIKNVTL